VVLIPSDDERAVPKSPLSKPNEESSGESEDVNMMDAANTVNDKVGESLPPKLQGEEDVKDTEAIGKSSSKKNDDENEGMGVHKETETNQHENEDEVPVIPRHTTRRTSGVSISPIAERNSLSAAATVPSPTRGRGRGRARRGGRGGRSSSGMGRGSGSTEAAPETRASRVATRSSRGGPSVA